MPLLPRQAPGTTIYSYSDSPSATSVSQAATSSSTVTTGNSGSSTPNSSLYLFTFLVTIVVLGLISGGLLFRAYYMRRRFHRRVEEAIRTGRPIPAEAAHALGLGGSGGRRGKKEKKVGPMPSLWEAEMRRDGDKWDGDEWDAAGAKDWDEITPLSIAHYHYTAIEPAAPDDSAAMYLPPPPVSPTSYLRSLLPSRSQPRPTMPPRQGTAQSIPRAQTRHGSAYAVPEEGDDVVVGVMIAMPVEGAAEQRWHVPEDQDEDEKEVPEVCLGVMSTRVRATGPRP